MSSSTTSTASSTPPSSAPKKWRNWSPQVRAVLLLLAACACWQIAYLFLFHGSLKDMAAEIRLLAIHAPGEGGSPRVATTSATETRKEYPGNHCKLRDISTYDVSKWEEKPTRIPNSWDKCLRFECSWDIETCDNTSPTNFDGSEPPCCVHVMRDMAREFDRVMCYLGLEYFPAYGMLLGLTRADRLIPWTIDNDYVVSKQTILAMQDVWDSASHLEHGILFLWDYYVYRICVTPTFADGQLLRWRVNETTSWYADSVYPFADIFFGEVNTTANTFGDQRECFHNVGALRPAQRRRVYNGSFYQNFPNKPDEILTEVYGANWRTPDSRKKSHGGTHCGKTRQRQKKRAENRKRKEEERKAEQQRKKGEEMIATKKK